jgi:hypothetical protein
MGLAAKFAGRFRGRDFRALSPDQMSEMGVSRQLGGTGTPRVVESRTTFLRVGADALIGIAIEPLDHPWSGPVISPC